MENEISGSRIPTTAFSARKKEGNVPQRWKTYGEAEGLPSRLNNHIFKVREQLVVGTEKGVYRHNTKTDRFEPDPAYADWLGNQSIRYLQEDAQGNIWFIHEKTVGWIDRSTSKPALVYIPELQNKLLSGFEFIYPYNDQNVFLAGEAGLYHLNVAKYRNQQETVEVSIRGVRLGLQSDSVLFGGFGMLGMDSAFVIDAKEKTSASNSPPPKYRSGIIGIQLPARRVRRALVGMDQTNRKGIHQPAGRHIPVRSKGPKQPGVESVPASFRFKLMPPWYQTSVAWALYLLVAGVDCSGDTDTSRINSGNNKFFLKRSRRKCNTSSNWKKAGRKEN